MDTKRTQILSPTTSSSSGCSSPEFEFWMVRNPSNFPQPNNLLSADELFVDGVLLPLHLLSTQNKPDPETPTSSPAITVTDSATSTASNSKRWKDIFRKSTDKENNNNATEEENEKVKDKGKNKRKEKKAGSGGGSSASASASAELNINIWPFSRSRSAGNSGTTRPKSLTRKVNSAPCSRSNSAGESKARKWPGSPGRVGVHLGRSSPVWQVRRKNPEPPSLNHDNSKRETPTSRRCKVASSGAGGGSAKAKVLNLNVPPTMCIGYRHQLSCRSDENSAIGVTVSGGSDHTRGSNGGHANVGGKHFYLRSFFTKKSIVTSH